MQGLKAGNQKFESKRYEDNKIRSQKNDIYQPENDTRKIDEVCLRGLVDKTNRKI